MTAALEGGEWSAARPDRTLPPGKDPVPILQEVVWAPGSVWTGGKSHPNRDSIPDRPARSQLLYRLSYRTHILLRYLLQITATFSHTFTVLITRSSKFYYTASGIITPTGAVDERILLEKRGGI